LLRNEGLGEYENAFREQGIDGWALVLLRGADNLQRQLGITSVDSQRKLNDLIEKVLPRCVHVGRGQLSVILGMQRCE
jgi:hypothetical protein